MAKLWNPGVFQGRGKKKNYFEGWYFKSVSKDEETAFAIIPGVSITRERIKSHAFIMLMDARHQQLYYFQYPLTDFWANKEKFEIRIKNNFFSENCVKLDLEDDLNKITAHLKFKNIIPWPVTLLSPGVMGWYAFIPFMECYHAVLSFNHTIKGHVIINGLKNDFNGGKGYIEKDWGSSMPSSWIWMQTNHFDEDQVSLFGSVANIPWLRSYFTGYIFGLYYKKHLYRFTTYTGAKIEKLNVSKDKIVIKIKEKHYKLEITANRTEGVDLPAPSMGEMKSRVNESLRSRINVKLIDIKKGKEELIFKGTGRNSGLEFVGDVNELLKGFKN